MPRKPEPKSKSKRPQARKPSAATSAVDVEKLVESTFGGKVVLASADRPAPATSESDRKMQSMKAFFSEVKFDLLEEDIEALQEFQMVINRRGDDNTSKALGRVVELLEALQDTGETCGFSQIN